MLDLLFAAAIAACAIPSDLAPAPALPPEESRIVPVEHLVLAYYWWPQGCRHATAAEAAGCNAGFGLRVHGLWPDGAGTTYPQFCRAAPPLDLTEVRRNWCNTPSPGLLQHEWAKHGTCHWPDAASYFAEERRVAATIALPDLGPPVASAGAVRDALVAANPTLPRTAIFVGTDKNQWLTEVRVCLDLGERPEPCVAGTGAADAVPLRVWTR
jgi:ribonuclease T2